jgi:hypothetical protein
MSNRRDYTIAGRRAWLIAALVAATHLPMNAIAEPRPGCSAIEPGPLLDLCDRQDSIYDAISEDGELIRDHIDRLERKIG